MVIGQLILMGICCMAKETQTGALYKPRRVGWGGRWEGGSKGKELCCPGPGCDPPSAGSEDFCLKRIPHNPTTLGV